MVNITITHDEDPAVVKDLCDRIVEAFWRLGLVDKSAITVIPQAVIFDEMRTYQQE